MQLRRHSMASEPSTFLKNAWYVAAWADEVEEGRMLCRQLLDEYYVFFRDAGAVHARRVLAEKIKQEQTAAAA